MTAISRATTPMQPLAEVETLIAQVQQLEKVSRILQEMLIANPNTASVTQHFSQLKESLKQANTNLQTMVSSVSSVSMDSILLKDLKARVSLMTSQQTSAWYSLGLKDRYIFYMDEHDSRSSPFRLSILDREGHFKSTAIDVVEGKIKTDNQNTYASFSELIRANNLQSPFIHKNMTLDFAIKLVVSQGMGSYLLMQDPDNKKCLRLVRYGKNGYLSTPLTPVEGKSGYTGIEYPGKPEKYYESIDAFLTSDSLKERCTNFLDPLDHGTQGKVERLKAYLAEK